MLRSSAGTSSQSLSPYKPLKADTLPSRYLLGHEKRRELSKRLLMALSNMFSDLEFADYICLLVHCRIDMHAKTIDLKSTTAKLGLKVK